MKFSSAIFLLPFPLPLFVPLSLPLPFITTPFLLSATKQADGSTFLPARAYNSIQTDSHHFAPCSTDTLPAVQYHLQFPDRYRIRAYYQVPVTSGIKLQITASCVTGKKEFYHSQYPNTNIYNYLKRKKKQTNAFLFHRKEKLEFILIFNRIMDAMSAHGYETQIPTKLINPQNPKFVR